MTWFIFEMLRKKVLAYKSLLPDQVIKIESLSMKVFRANLVCYSWLNCLDCNYQSLDSLSYSWIYLDGAPWLLSYEGSLLPRKEEIQNYLKVLLNISQRCWEWIKSYWWWLWSCICDWERKWQRIDCFKTVQLSKLVLQINFLLFAHIWVDGPIFSCTCFQVFYLLVLVINRSITQKILQLMFQMIFDLLFLMTIKKLFAFRRIMKRIILFISKTGSTIDYSTVTVQCIWFYSTANLILQIFDDIFEYCSISRRK